MADFLVDRTAPNTSAYDTTYIRQTSIKALENKLVVSECATSGDVPEHAGSTISWQLDANVTGATATNALTDDSGTPITYATRDNFNEDTYSPTAVTKQLHAYGTFVPVRTKDLNKMPRGMMDRLAGRMAYRGAHTKDTLLIAAIDGSGSSYNPGLGTGTTTTRKSIGDGTNNTTISATDQLTVEDIALGVGDLWANDAEEFSNGAYKAIIHSVSATHLITDVSTSRITWEETHKHVGGASGQEKILKGTIGTVVGADVVRSNNIRTSTQDTETVYNNIILAMDGVGDASVDDSNPQVLINRPNENSTDNPYRMYATAAFVWEGAPTLLDSNRALVLYAAD